MHISLRWQFLVFIFSHQNVAQGTKPEIKNKYKFKEPSGMLRYIAWKAARHIPEYRCLNNYIREKTLHPHKYEHFYVISNA